MKKLMIAAAALTAGVAMADIVSSDIVGYASNGLQNGATMIAPQFLYVGDSEAMPIEALTPTGSNPDGVEIQTLTALGYTDKYYTWNTWFYSEPCWVDKDLNTVTDVSFDPGQGLWVQGSSSAQYIRFPAPEFK